MTKSPCISICKIDDETGYCQGCKRTVNEIMSWPKMDDEEKQIVLENLEERD